MDVLLRSGAVGACLALMVYVGTLFAPRGTPWTVLVTFASGAALSALEAVRGDSRLNWEQTQERG